MTRKPGTLTHTATMHDNPSGDDPWESLESFRCGDTGIDYDTLCRFAGPIFHLFGFEGTESDSEDRVDDRVAALETARLMWAFFECGGQRDWEKMGQLQSTLFGKRCSSEEQAAMSILIEQLGARWESLPLSVRRSKPGRPSFDSLLSMLDSDANATAELGTPASNGRSHADVPVDSPDALAAFASPLLDDPAIDDDPDRLSEMMARAQDYWHLATLTGEHFVREIERLADKYATTTEEKSAVRAEANLMVARFHKLFPHWT
ncbi:MAG: hypothetical protein R3282_09525 [Rhodothermales bacterium]|nr:hypothetical protein [Rhodothermales bacterium]